MLIFKKIYSKKTDSELDLLFYNNKYLFYLSLLTYEYRYTESPVWIRNFSKTPSLIQHEIELYLKEEIEYLILIGRKSQVKGKMLPIDDKSYAEIFKKLISKES